MPTSAAAQPSPSADDARTGDPRAADERVEDPRVGDTRSDDQAGSVRLDRDAAERVLRRAVELDSGDDAHDRRISLQALLEAADELGIDRAEVHRAVHEQQIGLLDVRRRRSDRLLGPDRFVAVRAVEGAPERVVGICDEWLRRGGVLRRTRSPATTGMSGQVVDYTRRTDAVAGVQRAFHSAVGSERLVHVRRVRLVVTDMDDGRTAVGLIVDASRSRTNATAGAGAVTACGSLMSMAALHGANVLAGVAASAAAGFGVIALRRSLTAGVPEELEALLDAVARGRRPTAPWRPQPGL